MKKTFFSTHYSNLEYIMLYSERLDLSDKDWVMDSIRGDHLSVDPAHITHNE